MSTSACRRRRFCVIALGHALLAAFWLVGLWVAAPLLKGGSRAADRMRDAVVLGSAIPFVLGLLHLLYWPACWIALAACVAARFRQPRTRSGPREPLPYVLLGALALVAWPPLVRPLLDGDTLVYHLPNVAAWAHAHSLWTTNTRYWWYPPVSELFATPIDIVATPFALGWSGFAALSLLGLRIFAWAREGALLPVRLADAFAAAVVCMLPIALQSGSLRNDVWLAAFFVETLWSAPVDDASALRSAAMCALIKPDGWVYAAVALAASRATRRAWLAAGAAVVVWGIHDAVLWRVASLSPVSTMFPKAPSDLVTPSLWKSTIAAHPFLSLQYGGGAAAHLAPFGLLLFLAALASPLLARASPLNVAGIAAGVVTLFIPYGFADAHAQLASGESLRYAAPAIAVGAIILAPHLLRFARVALWASLAGTLGEGLQLLAVYGADWPTLFAPAAACAVPLTVVCARVLKRRRLLYVGSALAIIVTTMLAGRSTVAFYTDSLSVHGYRSRIYAWIARERPPRIAGWGLRAGTVAMLSPSSLAVDVSDTDPCGDAKHAHAILVAVKEATHGERFNDARMHEAALCGRTLYRDRLAIAVTPRS